jgi:serine/threonine-protein kinase
MKHVSEQAVHLSVHRPDLPPDLSALVMKLIEKDPADRYQTAAEVAREIVRIRDSTQGQAGASIVETPAFTGVHSVTESHPARPRNRFHVAARLKDFRLTGNRVAAMVLLGLAAGALAGYRARSEDYLSPNAATAKSASVPGLWIADWGGVEKLATPASQYHHALFSAPDAEREAAWLAVPGYFPGAKEWREKAYIQLTRTLYRHHDAERLAVLAKELAEDGRFQEPELARIAGAAAAGLGNDPADLLESFAATNIEHMAPALAEISLEIVSSALRSTPASDPNRDRLRRIREELLETLQLLPPLRPPYPGPR